MKEFRAQLKVPLRPQSKALLRKQVQDFAKWLDKQGVVLTKEQKSAEKK